MSKTTSRLATAFLCGTALASTVVPAFGAIETVTVTAQRRDENILDVPYNISAVSGDRIDQLQIKDNAELMRSIPGVGIVDRGERNGSVVNGIRIRGLNVDSSALGDYSVSAVSTVATYVDGTPIFANFALKDIERVEVLKGPQGTLYGSGALGGAVRYIMRKPDFDGFSGSVTASGSQVADSGGVGAAADIVLNVPLSDELAFRVSGSYYNYPGITDYVNVYQTDANGVPLAPSGILSTDALYENVKDADFYRGWYGRAALLWQPTSTFNITLSGMGESDEYGGRRAQALGMDGFGRPYQERESGAMLLEPGARDVWLGAVEANLDLGFATLTSSTSYYNHHGDVVSDNTGFYAQNGWWGAFYYNYPRPIADEDRLFTDKAFIQELRLVSATGGAFDYTVGAYYSNQITFGTQDSILHGFKDWCAAAGCFLSVISDQDYKYRRRERFTEIAAFGELTWHVNDDLQFTGGFRAFRDKGKTEVLQEVGLYTLFFGSSFSVGQSESSRVLFKGNGSWKFSEDGMLYATISQGYRRGGSNGTPTAGFFAESPAWLTYDPDDVVNYELGVKGTSGNWVYNLDVFYVDWHDPQLNTGTTNWGFFAVQNGDSATTKGFEAQIENYTGNWHTALGYTYTDAKLAADLISADGVFTINTKGAQLPGAPKHVLTGGVDYTMPFQDGTSLFLHADGFYQSMTQDAIYSPLIAINAVDYPGQPKFYHPMDGFAIFNASATYTFGDWNATLWMKNILDDPGITGVYTEAYMGTSPAQNYFGNASKAIYALPRTIGLTVNTKF